MNLEVIYLWGNELTGEIPSEIGDLNYLISLHLAHNQFTGEIPIEFSKSIISNSSKFENSIGISPVN
jgi:hypothetical protein